jgi:hypothetical protein
MQNAFMTRWKKKEGRTERKIKGDMPALKYSFDKGGKQIQLEQVAAERLQVCIS